MKFSFAIAGLALAFVCNAPAPAAAQTTQTLLGYTFDDTTGTPTTTASGVMGSAFTRDPADDTFYDNTAGNPAPDANSGGWTTDTALDPTLYYTFTITPAAGGTSWNTLTLDVANFDAADIDDGPTQFAVRSSLDSFTTDLLGGAIGNSFSTESATLDVTSSVPVEYRIYGFGAGTTDGLFQIDNVALTLVTPAPEPSTTAAVGLALLLGGLVFVRRRA